MKKRAWIITPHIKQRMSLLIHKLKTAMDLDANPHTFHMNLRWIKVSYQDLT